MNTFFGQNNKEEIDIEHYYKISHWMRTEYADRVEKLPQLRSGCSIVLLKLMKEKR